jgi:propanol-preferring alcohol dehydrogenase
VIPGHQVVGTVEALGEGAKGLSIGYRVGVTWLNSACGNCDMCDAGKENLCEKARFTGLDVDGGYAEYVTVPTACAFPLPDGFPDSQAAPLLCAGVIGLRSLRLSEIRPGGRLGLFGFGASAHVTIQVARHRGCEVYVFTRSTEHRKHALELGAAWAGDARDDPPELMDASITFAPAGWVVHEALRTVKPGGTVAINAIHMSPVPELPYHLIYGERTLRSVANLTGEDARELLELAAEVPLKTDVEEYRLEEANEVLQRLKRSEVRGAAVLNVSD